ncbi:hypothetical protein AK812_SmicGene11506 [Symbiodinium microadriaticum]|uniref:Uncharacterized protein n=1 Tax=Symbiodinium microadriaticum TaxID=2951 RepID=A0A1Q9ED77_SYMMI|nr:hypothetical protein AK812_SmicGene11506 [Symbiodinium microadriaticum]
MDLALNYEEITNRINSELEADLAKRKQAQRNVHQLFNEAKTGHCALSAGTPAAVRPEQPPSEEPPPEAPPPAPEASKAAEEPPAPAEEAPPVEQDLFWANVIVCNSSSSVAEPGFDVGDLVRRKRAKPAAASEAAPPPPAVQAAAMDLMEVAARELATPDDEMPHVVQCSLFQVFIPESDVILYELTFHLNS